MSLAAATAALGAFDIMGLAGAGPAGLAAGMATLGGLGTGVMSALGPAMSGVTDMAAIAALLLAALLALLAALEGLLSLMSLLSFPMLPISFSMNLTLFSGMTLGAMSAMNSMGKPPEQSILKRAKAAIAKAGKLGAAKGGKGKGGKPDFVLATGTLVMFKAEPTCLTPAPNVPPPPIPMQGSAKKVKLAKQPICLLDDWKKVKLPYLYNKKSWSFPMGIPGMGMFTITKLGPKMLTEKALFEKKKAMRKGKKFEAKFMVLFPCMKLMTTPAGPIPIPDFKFMYKAEGKFIPLLPFLKAG